MSTKRLNLIIWSSIFVAAFFLSFILFLVQPDREDRFVLFFPSETTSEWVGEGRNIAHMREIEDSVHELLKEIALGPTQLRLQAAVPPNTRVRSVILSDTALYVDFSEHISVPGKGQEEVLARRLDGVRKSVLFNFPSIESVVFFVQGFPAG